MWHLILLHAIFSTTFTIGKAALLYVQPIFFVGMRMACSGLLLLGYQLFFKGNLCIYKKDFWWFIQIIFWFIYLSYILGFWALEYIESSMWALIFTLSPFFVAFFSYYFFNEKITKKKVLGFVIGLIGIVPTILLMSGNTKQNPRFFFYLFPELVMMISVICYAYGWTIFRKLSKDAGYSSIIINGVCMFFGGILLLLTSPFMDTWNPSPIMNIPGFFAVIAAIIAVNIFTFLINVYLMRFYTATLLIFLIFVDPLYVSLYGWLFLGETVSWYFFVSIIGVFLGLYLFYQEDLRQGYVMQ